MPNAENAKVSRRGISNNTRGTQRRKFSHEDAKTNGLFLAHIEDIQVNMITIGESTTGMPSFNGLDIPKLVITFASNEDEIVKRKYATLQFNAVESNVNTIPGGKEEWKINCIFDWLKHILNTYILRGREMTADEEALLALSYEDFDEQGAYVPVEPEVVIAAWKSLFENFANMMNTGRDGAPYYKTKDNKNIPLWVKLLRCTKTRNKGWVNINNGDLVFPTFVGEGCIDIWKANTPSNIRVDSIKESIIPRVADKEAKAPNNPANPGGMGVPTAMPMGGVMLDADNISAEAGEDTPF